MFSLFLFWGGGGLCIHVGLFCFIPLEIKLMGSVIVAGGLVISAIISMTFASSSSSSSFFHFFSTFESIIFHQSHSSYECLLVGRYNLAEYVVRNFDFLGICLHNKSF